MEFIIDIERLSNILLTIIYALAILKSHNFSQLDKIQHNHNVFNLNQLSSASKGRTSGHVINLPNLSNKDHVSIYNANEYDPEITDQEDKLENMHNILSIQDIVWIIRLLIGSNLILPIFSFTPYALQAYSTSSLLFTPALSTQIKPELFTILCPAPATLPMADHPGSGLATHTVMQQIIQYGNGNRNTPNYLISNYSSYDPRPSAIPVPALAAFGSFLRKPGSKDAYFSSNNNNVFDNLFYNEDNDEQEGFIGELLNQQFYLRFILFILISLIIPLFMPFNSLESNILIWLAYIFQDNLIRAVDWLGFIISLEGQNFCFLVFCGLLTSIESKKEEIHEKLHSIKAALQYFVASSLASGLLIWAISLLYIFSGSLEVNTNYSIFLYQLIDSFIQITPDSTALSQLLQAVGSKASLLNDFFSLNFSSFYSLISQQDSNKSDLASQLLTYPEFDYEYIDIHDCIDIHDVIDDIVSKDWTRKITYIKNIVIGVILFKLGVVPVHFWMSHIYNGTNSILLLYISTIPKFCVLSFIILNLNDINTNYTFLFVILLCGFIGSTAYFQPKIRNLLLYSSISEMGLLISVLETGGINTLLFHLSIYIISQFLLWNLVTACKNGNKQITSINFITPKGRNGKNFQSWYILLFLSLSLAGIPPFIGFFGKAFILWHQLSVASTILLIFSLIWSFISAIYYIRLIRIIYFSISPQQLSLNSLNNPSIYFYSSHKPYTFYKTNFALANYYSLSSAVAQSSLRDQKLLDSPLSALPVGVARSPQSRQGRDGTQESAYYIQFFNSPLFIHNLHYKQIFFNKLKDKLEALFALHHKIMHGKQKEEYNIEQENHINKHTDSLIHKKAALSRSLNGPSPLPEGQDAMSNNGKEKEIVNKQVDLNLLNFTDPKRSKITCGLYELPNHINLPDYSINVGDFIEGCYQNCDQQLLPLPATYGRGQTTRAREATINSKLTSTLVMVLLIQPIFLLPSLIF